MELSHFRQKGRYRRSLIEKEKGTKETKIICNSSSIWFQSSASCAVVVVVGLRTRCFASFMPHQRTRVDNWMIIDMMRTGETRTETLRGRCGENGTDDLLFCNLLIFALCLVCHLI